MGAAAIKAWKTRQYIAKAACPARAHGTSHWGGAGRRVAPGKKEGTRLAPDA
jgi:hypothetical protein